MTHLSYEEPRCGLQELVGSFCACETEVVFADMPPEGRHTRGWRSGRASHNEQEMHMQQTCPEKVSLRICTLLSSVLLVRRSHDINKLRTLPGWNGNRN